VKCLLMCVHLPNVTQPDLTSEASRNSLKEWMGFCSSTTVCQRHLGVCSRFVKKGLAPASLFSFSFCKQTRRSPPHVAFGSRDGQDISIYVYRYFDTSVSPVSFGIFCADNKGLR
jgi:hypothetical protein